MRTLFTGKIRSRSEKEPHKTNPTIGGKDKDGRVPLLLQRIQYTTYSVQRTAYRHDATDTVIRFTAGSRFKLIVIPEASRTLGYGAKDRSNLIMPTSMSLHGAFTVWGKRDGM